MPLSLPLLVGAAATLIAGAAAAQTRLPPVLITGNPLAEPDPAVPAASLAGDALTLQRAGTLGETLDGLPGISASGFGPNASRPVIRGLDGDRVRLLTNSGASIDASAVSLDHAVPIDPLVVERIEVLRGPAALQYGGGAIGGVVNAIDNRIPRAPLAGVGGAADARLGGAADERGLSALVEAGGDAWALHADAFARRTSDLRAPLPDRSRVVNSAAEASGGAFGASRTWADGYLGASVDRYRNDYGVVVEEGVSIAMRRDRAALAGEARALGGFIDTLRGHVAVTDYAHRELEDGTVGTTFRNRGGDARLEAVHRAVALGGGQLRGVFGAQAERTRFAALGDEAFVPTATTRSAALFAIEQWQAGALRLNGGLRVERVRVASAGDPPGSEPRFGAPRSRRFTPASASIGTVFEPSAGWQWSASLSATQRAPTQVELFADGVHVATAAYERGNPAQRLERGRNLDVALQWSADTTRVKLGAFASRFSRYIALRATGEPDVVGDEGEAFPVFAFEGVRARLRGLEAEAAGRAFDAGGRTLDLDARFDIVRGDDLDHREPLPRIAPARASLGATLQQGGWRLRGELQHAARQSRVPADDRPTPAWTQVHLTLSRRFALGEADALWFVRLANLSDELAFNAAAIRSVRERSPLPGRSLLTGLRVGF